MKLNFATPAAVREFEKLARAEQSKAHLSAMGYRAEIERRFGKPVQILQLEAGSSVGGTVRPVWNQQKHCKFHSVLLTKCAPWLWPHKLAHELTHIELEASAHAAGKRKTHVPGPLVAAHPEFRLPDDGPLLRRLFSFACNVPVDIIVENRLRTRFQSLAPAQFVNLWRLVETDAKDRWTPNASPTVVVALESLWAVRALSVDRLLGNVTHFFDRFEGSTAAAKAKELHEEFAAAYRTIAPGDHYGLVNRFAEVIGLPDLHAWDSRTTVDVLEDFTGPSID